MVDLNLARCKAGEICDYTYAISLIQEGRAYVADSSDRYSEEPGFELSLDGDIGEKLVELLTEKVEKLSRSFGNGVYSDSE